MKIKYVMLIALSGASFCANAQGSVSDSARVLMQTEAMLKEVNISKENATFLKRALVANRLAYEKKLNASDKSFLSKDTLAVQNRQNLERILSSLTPDERRRFMEWIKERMSLFRSKVIEANLDNIKSKKTKER